MEFVKLIRQFQKQLIGFKFLLSHPRSKSFFESKTYNSFVLFFCFCFLIPNVFFDCKPHNLKIYRIFDIILFSLINLEMIIKFIFLKKEILTFWLYKLEFGFFISINLLAIFKLILIKNSELSNFFLSNFLFFKLIISILLILNKILKNACYTSNIRSNIDVFFSCFNKLAQTYFFISVISFSFVGLIRFSHPNLKYTSIITYLIK